MSASKLDMVENAIDGFQTSILLVVCIVEPFNNSLYLRRILNYLEELHYACHCTGMTKCWWEFQSFCWITNPFAQTLELQQESWQVEL